MISTEPYTEKIELESQEKISIGEIQVSTPTFGERLGKTIGIGILMLIVTAVAALIPIIHFITVPILLIVTLFVVASTARAKPFIDSGTGHCPVCSGDFRIMRRRYGLPFSDVCEKCGRTVVVRKPE